MHRTGRKPGTNGRVRGQWIILTALALVVAVAVVYMAYVSSEVLPAASIQRPAYGLMSQDWPKLVQLLAGYTRFVAQSGLSGLTAAAAASGLYNNLLSPYPQSIHLQLTAAGSYVANSLAAAESNLLSIGAFISSSYRLNQSGFAGSLGPYPAAVVLSNIYNFSKLYGLGYIQFSSNYVYRFVVTTFVPVSSDYVVIYSGDVRKPVVPGESYNSIVNTILNLARQGDSFDAASLRGKLYLILVNNSALAEALSYYAGEGCSQAVRGDFQNMLAKAFVVLPWWAEYIKCPFCLFDFKMPRGSLATPGTSDEIAVLVYADPTSSVDIYLYIPYLLDAFGIQPSAPIQCYEQWNLPYIYTIQQADSGNNNPYAVYYMNGQEWFFDAYDLSGWQSSLTFSQCHQMGPEYAPTPIEKIISTNIYGNWTNGLLLGAVYPAGTYDVGFNIWRQFSIPNNWPGFQVRTLVNVTAPGAEKMGFLSLYFGGYDGSTFPWCADMVAVQPEFYPPTFVWSFLPQGYGSGPWQTYAWQQGGSYVPLGNDWYVLSISQILQGPMAGQMYLSVYKFVVNQSGPMSPYAGQWLTYSPLTTFNVVLGTDTEDFPQSSSSSWTDAAVYAFLAARPWTYPEPSAVLTAVGAAPVVNTPRPTIIAWGPASAASARVSTLGNISLALVMGLNITTNLSVTARAKSIYIYQYNTTFIKYSYGILVNSSLPKSSLGAQFSLFYNYGGGVYNYTCGAGPTCNASLTSYYGYTAGVDSALWNITFLVPRHSNFAVVAKVLGASIAVNNYSVVHPLVYYLWSGNSLYLINVGNSDAVFYFPWQNNESVVSGVSPNDGIFGAYANINVSGIGSWTLVIVPPASAVNVTFYPQYAAQIQGGFPTQFTPAWELPYIQPAQAPSSGCAYLPTYFPSQFLEDHYTLLIPSLILRAIGKQPSSRLSFYVFMKGSWTQAQYALDNLNDVWLRINAYPGWFSYRGTLIAVCGGGSSSPLPSLFTGYDYYSAALPSPGALAQYANLLSHPSGYAVIVNVTGVFNPRQTIQAIYLYNKSAPPPSQCPEGSYSGEILEFYNGYPTGTGAWYDWWNQFAGVCRDQNVWTYYGTGRESFFIFAVTRDSAYFYIATASSSGLYPFNYGGTVYWWFNGWANTQYNAQLLTAGPYNGPLYSFDSVSCINSAGEVCNAGVIVMPFMWPQPYFIIDGQIYQTI
ncbi:MAG: hypothetical protein JZD41_00390 [Thermoproteus sp.]|nr:hypothetical protein [Thermoproteus sp.]